MVTIRNYPSAFGMKQITDEPMDLALEIWYLRLKVKKCKAIPVTGREGP
jgi:hypothetical protein